MSEDKKPFPDEYQTIEVSLKTEVLGPMTITMALAPEDLDKLRTAFAEGKLDILGISEIRDALPASKAGDPPTPGKWVSRRLPKGEKPRGSHDLPN